MFLFISNFLKKIFKFFLKIVETKNDTKIIVGNFPSKEGIDKNTSKKKITKKTINKKKSIVLSVKKIVKK